MAEAPAAPVEFGPEMVTLSEDLLPVLIAGNASRLVEFLSSSGQTNGHVAINVLQATTPAPPGLGTSCCLLGVTSNGNTALHLVASRGHADLAALICKNAPSLVGTRNRGLDTPLHCAARGGHREVTACLLFTMLNSGVEEAAAVRATNLKGDTALHEAVRHGHAEVVELFTAEAPDLASVTSDDGVSPLYLAASTGSVKMVGLLLRPLPDGTPSSASSAGRAGRTALHVAATCSKEMVENILAWEPQGPSLLTRLDLSGRSPLHFAVRDEKLDVVELFLSVNNHLARICDNNGSYPVHYAARGPRCCAAMVYELIMKCPEYYELIDNDGWNLLHVAAATNNHTVVRYICQNERFAMLLNTTDFKGNTPLHLAVKYGYKRIVSVLLQSTGVELNIHNRDGLTARDLSYNAVPERRLFYFLEPAVTVHRCLCWADANESFDSKDLQVEDESAKEECKEYMKGTIATALIASVTFAAAFTVPGGIIADEHLDPGTAILARRLAFKSFVLTDTTAFLCSIVATGFILFGGVSTIPRNIRSQHILLSSGLVPVAAQFMIASFALGLHLILGASNRFLIIIVYMVSLASVSLFVSTDIWIPLHIYETTNAIWRRAGWKGLLNMHKRPLGPVELFERLSSSPLAIFSGGLSALLICAIFMVVILAEIFWPNQ